MVSLHCAKRESHDKRVSPSEWNGGRRVATGVNPVAESAPAPITFIPEGAEDAAEIAINSRTDGEPSN